MGTNCNGLRLQLADPPAFAPPMRPQVMQGGLPLADSTLPPQPWICPAILSLDSLHCLRWTGAAACWSSTTASYSRQCKEACDQIAAHAGALEGTPMPAQLELN